MLSPLSNLIIILSIPLIISSINKSGSSIKHMPFFKYFFYCFDYIFIFSIFVQAHAIGIRGEKRVVSENHQDCIADIDFHIWNLRISASLPWFRPFIRQ